MYMVVMHPCFNGELCLCIYAAVYMYILQCVMCECACSYLFPLARDAMKKGRSPVVIDNTNTNAWEMKPYVLLVSDHDSVHV